MTTCEICSRGRIFLARTPHVSDPQIDRDAREHVGLLAREALVAMDPLDHLEQRVARRERHVLGEVGKRADFRAVEIRVRRRHQAFRLDRVADGRVELARREALELVAAFVMRA
jgi:hypothetical protein